MNYLAIQQVLKQWAAAQTGVPVTWADQNAPRLPYTPGFVMLNIIAEVQIGQDEVRYELNTGTNKMIPHVGGNRTLTVSCQAFTLSVKPPADSRSLIAKLRTSLKKPSVLQLFHDNGIAVVDAEGQRTMDELVDGRWISRSLMDIRIAVADNIVDDEISYIETVEATGTVEDTDVEITGTFGVGE